MADIESVPNPRSPEEKAEVAARLELPENREKLEAIKHIQSKEIVCGGLVTNWREGVSQKGNPYGILTVEDYSGKHDFALFGQAYPTYSGYGKPGMYLVIHAKYQPKRFLRDAPKSIFDLEFSIGKIELLNEVADNMIESMTVVIDNNQLMESQVNQIIDEIIRPDQPKTAEELANAKTGLYFEICDAMKNYCVRLFSRKHKVHLSTEMVNYLRSLDGCSVKINDHLVEDEHVAETEDENADMMEEDLVSTDD